MHAGFLFWLRIGDWDDGSRVGSGFDFDPDFGFDSPANDGKCVGKGFALWLAAGMKREALHLGMAVVHPEYGSGIVKAINEYAAEVEFSDGRKPVDPEASDLEPAEAQCRLTGLNLPLRQILEQTVEELVDRLGLEKPDSQVRELASKWAKGTLVLRPADPKLQTKEIELEVFFHKLVMMRNQLRVLEQKINSSTTLTSAEKFDWQQYVTRCYGSMTTFNLLFKDKESHFGS